MLLVIGGLLLVAAIVLVVVLVVDSGSNTSAPANPSAPLRVSAHGHDFLVGAAVSDDALRSEPPYAKTLAHEYNAVTPENALKWDRVHPAADRYDFTAADTIVDFAHAHAMTVRGHTLVWHRSIPAWITDRK